MKINFQIFPHIKIKDKVSDYLKNMRVTSKVGTSTLFVDFNCANFPDRHEFSCADNIDSSVQIVNTNADAITFGVERNFYIKNVLEGILKCESKVSEKPKNIVIDFSSPNIAKPFHVGHLRSTIIGNFISNINKYYNNKIIKINYLGDWGTQFGLLQYGLKVHKINLQELQNNPLKTLLNAYVSANKLAETDEKVQLEARQYFSNIEQGRTDLGDWKTIRDITVKELEKTYTRLGITFDAYSWESDYNGKAIRNLMKSLEENNIIKTDETGKKVATINNKNVTVLKSDDSTLYLSRDIAALIDRYNKYAFDEMLYVVDNSQTDHFSSLIEIVKRFNKECAERCKHVKFGRIKGMSTRSGNVVFLNDILDEAKQKMYDQQLKSKSKYYHFLLILVKSFFLFIIYILFTCNFIILI